MADDTRDDRFRQAEREALALLAKARQEDDPPLVDEAIARLRVALDDPSAADPVRSRRLHNLGFAYVAKFQRDRNRNTIDAAIDARREAAVLVHPPSSDFVNRQSALGEALRLRFETLGDPDDIERAVSVARTAVETAGAHPRALTNARAALASTLRVRYERLGDQAALDEAITQGRLAVTESAARGESRAGRLNNLSIALRDRYLQRRDDADLDEAISASGLAVSSATGDPLLRARCLTNHALALRSRHILHTDRGGLAGVGNPLAADDLYDIDAAIEALRQAVSLFGGPDSGFRKSALSGALLTRYEASHNKSDLAEAVSWAREAVRGSDPAHHDVSGQLNDLMYALTKAAAENRDAAEAEEAVRWGTHLVTVTAPGSANRALYLTNLGLAHRAHHEVTGDTTSRDAAIERWREAATMTTSVTAERINAAIHWALYANWSEPGSATALAGFRQVIELIPVLAWRGIARTSRERVLRDLLGLGGQAVAAALAGERPDLGLSFSEGSRGVLWSQLLDTSADFTELSLRAPDLAARLNALRAALDSDQ
ncbi:hypothetical protein [Amycolatopsis sp. CA-126428]|uniref:hypothetical protein n=1 Tax=Amycolatopsis sp. CA-126428 TaxID=2073158 RepID=UPI000CD32DCC|nr:hypothetical protein [Amycolatopsis sp. CA-126428]